MKVHIADSVSTGDNFLHPLGEIREVLERCVSLDRHAPYLVTVVSIAQTASVSMTHC